jgi:hypothetical protein
MSTAGPDKAEATRKLREHLAAVRRLRESTRADPSLERDRLAVRAWQTDRLARTYADLLANPRYAPAATFFLSDLYGTKDVTARDEGIARILPTMTRMLPAAALETIALALELDALSESLDQAMARTIRRGQPRGELAVTEASYAEAYRSTDRRERERQIALVGRIGAALDRLARKPLLAGALTIMEGPARAAGLAALHDFLVRGFHAFRHMRGADEFLATVAARETQINDRLHANAPAAAEAVQPAVRP